jgi:ornithine cyclodeaminase/alanine dehydrogenase-like protein (mu-crystallin family)
VDRKGQLVTLLLSDADVRGACDIRALVNALEGGLRREAKSGAAIIPERVNLGVSDTFLRVMPAILPESGLMGLKFFQGSTARGVRYVVAVCLIETGEVLALIDAAYLTAARTGATSGVATRLMAREDASTVGVIGSGLEAETNLTAVCGVRNITDVTVYSRSAERRGDFARRMSERLLVPVTAVESPEVAVRDRDLVVVATNTGPGGPVAYQGEWLADGQHVVSIGSTTPALREIDEATLLGADIVVFDRDAAEMAPESGDVTAAFATAPGWTAAVPLAEVLAGRVKGRRATPDRTVFKSVGTAAQDLLAASFVYQEARRLGIGRDVGDVAAPKLF